MTDIFHQLDFQHLQEVCSAALRMYLVEKCPRETIFMRLCLIFSSDEVPVFTEEPVSVVQKFGGSVSLHCSAQPVSAQVSWRLNGEQLTDGDYGVVVGPSSLFIPALSNLTLGRYQCVASTDAGALASVPANVTAASE